MMRVLMACKACGVGIYQRKLELIAQQGVDLRVLVPPSWRDVHGTQPLERVFTAGYDLLETPIWFNGRYHLYVFPQMARHLREFKPHVVHIDEEPYNLATWHALALAKRAGAKTVLFTWQNIRRDYLPPVPWAEKWAYRTADHIIAGTDSAGDVLRAKGYTGPVSVIPQFGTDTDLFRPCEGGASLSRPFTVGYVGRLVPEKGVDDLLRAVAQLTGDWRLRLVGSGPHKAALVAQAEQLGIAPQIDWVGWVPSPQMPDQLRLLDVLVLPSRTRPNWKEQFGRVLVEAMASGVPVVGSDSGAIPGVIGQAGRAFPEGDAGALAAHLRALQADEGLRAALGQAGRARAVDAFTHERIAAATVAVYRGI